MPMGTIVKLLNKQPNPETIGSFTSLYRGIEELNTENLWSDRCKTMLLCPNYSADTLIQKLKLNIDDTESAKYFCSGCCDHVSMLKDIVCPFGTLLDQENSFKFVSPNIGADEAGKVFVSSRATFIITDDSQIVPASFGFIHSLLENLGINDMKLLHLKTLIVGMNEIYGLLKLFLMSESTLTDTFLRDQCISSPNTHLDLLSFKRETENEISAESRQIIVKLIVQKATNKVIYAEAKEDFANLIFSFLTMPVGLVVKLLDGRSTLKCVDNLYKSVNDLNIGTFMGSSILEEMLVSPKLPPLYQCKSQLLDVTSHSYICVYKDGSASCDKYLSFEKELTPGYKSKSLHLIDHLDDGYVKGKGPCTFMVTDDLVVTPLSPISIISLLERFNLNTSSLEERVIHIGKEEALNLPTKGDLKISFYRK